MLRGTGTTANEGRGQQGFLSTRHSVAAKVRRCGDRAVSPLGTYGPCPRDGPRRPAVSSRARRCPHNPTRRRPLQTSVAGSVGTGDPFTEQGQAAGPTDMGTGVWIHGRKLGQAAGRNRGLILDQVLRLSGAVSGPCGMGNPRRDPTSRCCGSSGGSFSATLCTANGVRTAPPSTASLVCVKT